MTTLNLNLTTADDTFSKTLVLLEKCEQEARKALATCDFTAYGFFKAKVAALTLRLNAYVAR